MLKSFARFLPWAAIAVLLGLSLPYLGVPGPYEDEVAPTIPAIHVLTGEPPGPFGPYPNWKIGDRYIALLSQDYLSCLKCYTALPAFWLNGISLPSLRITSILIGAMAAAVGYFFLKNLTGPWPALLATAFLVTDPSYVFHNRHDWGPVSLMLLFKLGALFFLGNWWRGRRLVQFTLGSACLALGLLDKANFAWFVMALLPAFFLVSGLGRAGIIRDPLLEGTQPRPLRTRIAYISVLLIFLVLGSYFYIDRNFFGDGRVLGMMQGYEEGLQKFTAPALYARTLYHLNLFGDTLDGRVFYSFSVGELLPMRSLLPWLFWLTVVLWVFLRKRAATSFFLLLNLFVFAALVLTPEAGGSHHMMMIYPFPHYFAALVLWQLYETWRVRCWGRAAGVFLIMVCVTALTASNLLAVNAHYEAFRAGHTNWKWSSDTYRLVEYLRQKQNHEFHLFDWGIRHNVLFLTKGKAEIGEPFWSVLLDPGFPAQFERTFPKPGAIYILHSDEATAMRQPREWFLTLAQPALASGLLKECPIGSTFVVYEATQSGNGH